MKKFLLIALSLLMFVTVLPVLQASAMSGMFAEGGPPGGGEPPGDGHGGGGGRGGDDNTQIATTWSPDPRQTYLNPGETATFKMTVENKTSASESITLSTKDTGLTIAPTTFTLAAGAKTEVTATVIMPVQSDQKREAEFTITFTCTKVTGKAVRFRITYKSFQPTIQTSWSTDPSKTTLNAGSTASFTLKITNKGTAEETITLSTKSTGLTFSLAKMTIAAGGTASVTVKVVMPAQNNRAQAEFSIMLTGTKTKADVRFFIKYKTAICCTYTTAWASNPNGTKLAQKAKGTYYLTITNKCTSAITFKLAPGKNMAVSSSSFTLAAGKATKITVTVTMPAKTTSSKCDFSLAVGTGCGKNSTLKFTINYK